MKIDLEDEKKRKEKKGRISIHERVTVGPSVAAGIVKLFYQTAILFLNS